MMRSFITCTPSKIRMIKSRRMGWACNMNGEKKNRILMRKPEGKRPLGRPRNSGKMILKWI
jgi:hypothetical protein